MENLSKIYSLIPIVVKERFKQIYNWAPNCISTKSRSQLLAMQQTAKDRREITNALLRPGNYDPAWSTQQFIHNLYKVTNHQNPLVSALAKKLGVEG